MRAPQADSWRHGRGRSPVAKRRSSDAGGFSLIELLLVVAILLVLTVLYWGGDWAGDQKRKTRLCEENLQKLYVSMQIYAGDYRARFPTAPNAQTSEPALNVLIPKYTADTSIFICPASKDPALPEGESLGKHKISYAYYMGRRTENPVEALLSDRQINTLAKSAGQFAFSTNGQPPGNNHGKFGGNILFCDGHTESIPARLPFSLMLTQNVVLLNPKP